MGNIKKISSDERVIRGEGSEYIIENYLTNETTSNLSVAVSKLDGSIPKTKNIVSDRAYYFIEAKATVYFDDEQMSLDDGDVLYIPKDTSYRIEGKFKAVLINTPAFQIQNEVFK